jgi:hypothetical protein
MVKCKYFRKSIRFMRKLFGGSTFLVDCWPGWNGTGFVVSELRYWPTGHVGCDMLCWLQSIWYMGLCLFECCSGITDYYGDMIGCTIAHMVRAFRCVLVKSWYLLWGHIHVCCLKCVEHKLTEVHCDLYILCVLEIFVLNCGLTVQYMIYGKCYM